MGRNDIDDMIGQIEIFVDRCKTQTLSQNKAIVPKDEMKQMLDELRMKLPVEVERCKKILRNKDRILQEARTRSDAIISESVNEANKMIDQHEVTRLAHVRSEEIMEAARVQAQQIINQANDEANQIRLSAMDYTKEKLQGMRDIFSRVYEAEKENYRTLIESLEADSLVIENNISEMEQNINLFVAQSNMGYVAEGEPQGVEQMPEELDTAFATSQPQPENIAEREEVLNTVFADDEDVLFDDEINVYGDRTPASGDSGPADGGNSDDDDFDDFLDE